MAKKAKTSEASPEQPVEMIVKDGVIARSEPQPEVPAQPPEAAKPAVVASNKALFDLVVAEGLDFIKDGRSKAEAARAIYASLKDEPKEVIVAAFVAGATLTEKGALTYWYNCKRKAAKDEKKAGSSPA